MQSEIVARLKGDAKFAKRIREKWSRFVVDEVQDINPVQFNLIEALRGKSGSLTAVGDHRQAIYAFRGGRIDLMGRLYSEIKKDKDGKIVELAENYGQHRASSNSPICGPTPFRTERACLTRPWIMAARERLDVADPHVALLHFDDVSDEAGWIADTIEAMTSKKSGHGAAHDGKEGPRGIGFSDMAVLVRSSTDIRGFQDALRAKGIPAVVRGGPDLFSQIEVLLFLSAFAICGDIGQFYGSPAFPSSIPSRVQRALGVDPQPEDIVPAAVKALVSRGLKIDGSAAKRLVLLAKAIHFRTQNDGALPFDISALKCDDARRWLRSGEKPRGVFPQTLFHWLLHEAGIYSWGNDQKPELIEAVLFHVGQLSTIVKDFETSGWTRPEVSSGRSLRSQIGGQARKGRQAPLLVSPNAVSITTVHSAKGLEFPVVFLADVKARRFPSSRSTRVNDVPFDAKLEKKIDPALLADNDNYDNERRLMYVALTRAERYLFISYSGKQKSTFIKQLAPLVRGGRPGAGRSTEPVKIP